MGYDKPGRPLGTSKPRRTPRKIISVGDVVKSWDVYVTQTPDDLFSRSLWLVDVLKEKA